MTAILPDDCTFGAGLDENLEQKQYLTLHTLLQFNTLSSVYMNHLLLTERGG